MRRTKLIVIFSLILNASAQSGNVITYYGSSNIRDQSLQGRLPQTRPQDSYSSFSSDPSASTNPPFTGSSNPQANPPYSPLQSFWPGGVHPIAQQPIGPPEKTNSADTSSLVPLETEAIGLVKTTTYSAESVDSVSAEPVKSNIYPADGGSNLNTQLNNTHGQNENQSGTAPVSLSDLFKNSLLDSTPGPQPNSPIIIMPDSTPGTILYPLVYPLLDPTPNPKYPLFPQPDTTPNQNLKLSSINTTPEVLFTVPPRSGLSSTPYPSPLSFLFPKYTKSLTDPSPIRAIPEAINPSSSPVINLSNASLKPAPTPNTNKPQLPATLKPRDSGLMESYECRQENGYYGASNQCDVYIECQDNIARKYICPDGLNFNPNASYPDYPCAYPSEVNCIIGSITQGAQRTDQCPRRYGFFTMPDGDCSQYIMCQESKPTVMHCPLGLVFNEMLNSCDWPENVPQCNPNAFKNFTCPALPVDKYGYPIDDINKFKYGTQCKYYIACQRGHPRLLSCDNGLSFDDKSQTCINSKYVKDCAAT